MQIWKTAKLKIANLEKFKFGKMQIWKNPSLENCKFGKIEHWTLEKNIFWETVNW